MARLKAAGDYARRLGVFRARDMTAAGYSGEYLRRLLNREHVRQLSCGLHASARFDRDENVGTVDDVKFAASAPILIPAGLTPVLYSWSSGGCRS